MLNQFFVNTWQLDVWLAACFNTAPASLHKKEIQSIKVSLLDHRWGTLVYFLERLFAIAHLVTQFWDIQAVQVQQGLATQGDDGDRGQPAVERPASKQWILSVHAVIKDPMFWAFGRLVLNIAGCTQELTVWCEGCPCHPKPIVCPDIRTYFHRRRALRKSANLVKPCPFNGCRGPEAAGGHLASILQNARSHYHHDLIEHSERLTQEQRDTLMRDWSVGTSLLLATFEVKLGFWQQLPHILVGLNHWGRQVVQQIAVRSLQLWAAVADADIESQHPLAVLLLGRALPFPYRAQMELVAQGTSFQSPECKDLRLIVQRYRFVRLAERSIEGRHRKTTQVHAHSPHQSPAGISLAGRMQELLDSLESSRLSFKVLAERCARLRNARHIAEALDLLHHPDISAHGHLHFHDHCVVGHVAYRCDLRSQYAKRASIREAEQEQKRLRRGVVDEDVAAPQRVRQVYGTVDELLEVALAKAAFPYMQEYSKAGDLLSFPNVRALPLRYLDNSVHARDPYFDGAAALDQGPAVAAFRAAGEDASAASAHSWTAVGHVTCDVTLDDPSWPIFFCQVLKPNMSAEKSLLPGCGNGMLIARHRILHLDIPNRLAHVAAKSHILQAAGRAEMFTQECCVHAGLDVLSRRACRWRVIATCYGLSSLPATLATAADIQGAQDLVTELVHADAVAQGQGLVTLQQGVDESRQAVVAALVAGGLVESTQAGSAQRLRLSALGATLTVPFFKCALESRVLKAGGPENQGPLDMV